MASPKITTDHTLTRTGLRRHIPVLDGIRGFALILVLLHHFTDMTPVNAIDRSIVTTLHWGAIGIDLFFVLSGFLITGILADSVGKKGYFTSFYARRILRVFPLYYLIVAFSFLILPNLGEMLARAPGVSESMAGTIAGKLDRFDGVGGDQWMYWAYLSNFAVAKADAFRHGILGVSWSLSIEEQFYLLWPFAIVLVGALRMRWVCLSLVIISPLFRVAFLSLDVDPLFGGEPSIIDVLMLTPGRLEGIGLGAFLALHLRAGEGEHDPARRLRKLVPLAKGLFFVCMIGAMALELPRYLGTHEGSDPSVISATLGMFLVALSFFGLFILALSARPGGFWHRFWTLPVLLSLCKYSYAIYLLHMPIRAVIRDMFFGPRFDGERFGTAMFEFPTIFGSEILGQFLFYIPAFGLCWVAGWLSWHCFEKHFLKLKRFFPYVGHKSPKRQ